MVFLDLLRRKKEEPSQDESQKALSEEDVRPETAGFKLSREQLESGVMSENGLCKIHFLRGTVQNPLPNSPYGGSLGEGDVVMTEAEFDQIKTQYEARGQEKSEVVDHIKSESSNYEKAQMAGEKSSLFMFEVRFKDGNFLTIEASNRLQNREEASEVRQQVTDLQVLEEGNIRPIRATEAARNFTNDRNVREEIPERNDEMPTETQVIEEKPEEFSGLPRA